MDIYEKVTYLREQQGLSQSELERKAGLSKGTITNWKYRKPNMTSLEKVSNALECDIKYFLSLENDFSVQLSSSEKVLIENYRCLPHSFKERLETYLAALMNMQSLENSVLNAAHARTDIKPTADDVKHDEDIMDDDNF